jgi:hypoxanthine phosphoribosyltransferase
MTVVRKTRRIHASSWHETHREATDLAQRLQNLGPWAGMIAITRGGLVPAAIVARVLDIRLIDTICLASYDGESKGPVQIIKAAPDEIGDGEGWLLIDDVADSGATAEEARRQLPKAHYAAIYVKPAARRFVDTYLREIGQDVWVDFPWDRDPHVPDR